MAPTNVRNNVCEAVPSETTNVCEAPIQGEEVLSLEVPSYSPSNDAPLVCTADSFSEAPLAPANLYQYPASYAQQLFASPRLSEDSFNRGRAQRWQYNDSSDASVGSVAAGLLPAACTHDPVTEGDGGDPVKPPTDNPDIIIGQSDGGLGAGINSTFATGFCSLPRDMDPGSAGFFLATCGSTGLFNDADGIGTIERISTSGNGASAIQLPTTLNGGGKVYLTSTYSDKNSNLRFTGFAPGYMPDLLQQTPALLANSGFHIWKENETSFNVVTRIFEHISLPVPVLLENGQTATHFQPNTPVAMDGTGNQMYVVSDPKWVDRNGALTTAPVTIQRGSYNSSTGVFQLDPSPNMEAKIYGTQTPAAVHVIPGAYHAAGLGILGDGRVVVTSQGGNGGSSALHILTKDLAAGLPGLEGDNTRPAYTDVPLAFKASNSGKVAVVEINGDPYAVVGSADNSGRIALVNLQKNSYAEAGERVYYINVLDDDNNHQTDHGFVRDVLVRPDGKFAYVTTSTGKVRAVDLTDMLGAVGNVHTLHTGSFSLGDFNPSILTDGAIFSARSKAYSKAPISQ